MDPTRDQSRDLRGFSAVSSDLGVADQRPYEGDGPAVHVVDLRQLPLLESANPGSRKQVGRSLCSKFCCCCLLLLLLSAGAILGAGVTFFVMKDLQSNFTVPDIPTCPGVCAGRELHGEFRANVSRSKVVGPVTVVVSFSIGHMFDWDERTVNVSVKPIDFEPHWLPDVLHPIACDRVPFALDDGCNLTFTNECLVAAYKNDDITEMEFRWDGQEGIDVTEVIDTGFFKQVFTWTEWRSALRERLAAG
jgi:hypothetical protein